MATLCATLTEKNTSNIAVTDSNTALDLNIGSCLPVMYVGGPKKKKTGLASWSSS